MNLTSGLFRMVKACLDAIAESAAGSAAHPSILEIWLLKLEGYLPDITHCGECHRGFNEKDSVFMGPTLYSMPAVQPGRRLRLANRLQTQLRATQSWRPMFLPGISRAPSEHPQKRWRANASTIGRVLERQPRLRSTFQ